MTEIEFVERLIVLVETLKCAPNRAVARLHGFSQASARHFTFELLHSSDINARIPRSHKPVEVDPM